MRTLNLILSFIDNLNDWIGRILSYASFLMFILVLSEVVRRYFFNAPSVWANELTQLIFGAYVILSGGYILRWGGHVNVDIFYSTLSDRWKALLDILTAIVFFLFCGMLFVYGGQLAWESLSTFEHSQSAWNPPLYPFKLCIPIAAVLLMLQGLAKLIRDIITLVQGKSIDTGDTIEREVL